MTRKKTHKENGVDAERGQEARDCPEQRRAGRAAGASPAEAAARPEELRLLEALLFAAGEPLDEATLARAAARRTSTCKDALARLKAEYATRGVNLVRIGNKWTFRTADDLSWLLTKETVETRKLSRAAIETLAIIAYHQPVTRAEIEEIRGVVTATGTLDVLLRDRLDPPARPAQGAGPADHLWHHRGVPVAFRAGGGRRSAGPRRAQGLRPARRPSAARLRGADAVRRSARCATTRTRSSRAISTSGWRRRRSASEDD